MNCPLCEIPKNEKLLYDDKDIFLVQTKETKGHQLRVTAVTKTHSPEPTFQELVKVISLLNNYMEQRTEEWYICNSTYATIPEHFHLVACNTSSTDKEEIIQLSKTEKVLMKKTRWKA